MAPVLQTSKNAILGLVMAFRSVTSAIENEASNLMFILSNSNNITPSIKCLYIRSPTMSNPPRTSPTAFEALSRATNSVDLVIQLPMSMMPVPEIPVVPGFSLQVLSAKMAAAHFKLQIRVPTTQAQTLVTGGRINLWIAPPIALLSDYPMSTRDPMTVGKILRLLTKSPTRCRGFEPRQ